MSNKIAQSCIGLRIHYNFREHGSIKKTRAQEARVNVVKEKGNKWMDLLSLAMITNGNE